MKNLSLVACFVLMFCIVGCAANHACKNNGVSITEINEIKGTLQTCSNANRFCKQDHNVYAENFQYLFDKGYLTLDPEHKANFEFSFNYIDGDHYEIIAESNTNFSGGPGWVFVYVVDKDDMVVRHKR